MQYCFEIVFIFNLKKYFFKTLEFSNKRSLKSHFVSKKIKKFKNKIKNVNKMLAILNSTNKEERKNNWHSKYMHSHTLQQVIINVIQNYKSYINFNPILIFILLITYIIVF